MWYLKIIFKISVEKHFSNNFSCTKKDFIGNVITDFYTYVLIKAPLIYFQQKEFIVISKVQFKKYTSLKEKKYRDKIGRFLIEGILLCEEILESDFVVETLLYCPSRVTSSRGKQLIRKIRNAGIPIEELNPDALNKLSDTAHSQGIICIVRKKEFSFNELLKKSPYILVALDQIKDPGNLGTMIRTADWFGAGGILMSQDSVDLTNPKVLRATMGSVFHIPIFENQDLSLALLKLKQFGYALFVADILGSVSYSEVNFSPKNVLILGNEISGVREELTSMATKILKIPKIGKGDSLNVAVAAGIILAEMSKRRIQT
ncbi:MAG: TrmH family RNA methyltransferase [bacterium]